MVFLKNTQGVVIVLFEALQVSYIETEWFFEHCNFHVFLGYVFQKRIAIPTVLFSCVKWLK